jgi:periplasmic protein TonB
MSPRISILMAGAAVAWACAAFAGGDATIVSRTEPEFPREAMQAGATSGRVKARMTIDASGEVTRVEVVEANPHRVFDRAVMRSLAQWRFNPGADGRSYEIEIDFRR